MKGKEMENFSAKAIFNDIRNFLAGRFVGATRDEFLLEEVIKLIFCKRVSGIKSTEYPEAIELSNVYRKAFKKVVEIYSDIYADTNCEIALDPVSIQFVDNKINSIDFDNIERDIIGDAYEIFMGDVIKGQAGQFFTPQNAAELLVQMVAPKPNQCVLDLTCGAGGFLIAVLKYWNQNNYDVRQGINNLYGIDKDHFLTRLTKIHLACLTGDVGKIHCADSLEWNTEILGPSENAYDVILTNPPFGVNIQAGTKKTLQKFETAHKVKKCKEYGWKYSVEINEAVPPQVVFLEQSIRLLKDDGILGIVVPESLISSKKYMHSVAYILRTCKVEAIVGMPEDLFKTSGKGGTHTKTCLMVLRKLKHPEFKLGDDSWPKYNLFMAEAKWCGHDSRGKAIPHDDLPTISENYSFYQNKEYKKEGALGFIISSDSIENYVLAPRAYSLRMGGTKQENDDQYFFIVIKDLIREGVLKISTGDEVGKLAYGTGSIPFVRTSDISNWEIKSDPKHLVSDEIYSNLATKQDIQEGDILMVKDGSYLIGTCAMVSQYDTKIVYQSHFYKIRLAESNKYHLDRYYLLAALSSDFFKRQIEAKTFSQDIINSLGDRLKELIIPVHRDAEIISNISKMVKKSIHDRIEARELGKKARTAFL